MFPEVLRESSSHGQLPTDQDLPSDDGEPMETPWHRYCMNVLVESLEYHRRDRKDFYCGGNMFLYFSPEQVFNKDFRGPDFYVVNGVDHDRPRLSWVTWQEGYRFPDVIVELTSPSTADVDRGPKLELYRDKFRTPEYYVYDPETRTFEGYQRRNGSVDPLEIEPGNRVWSRSLELYLGTWEGTYMGLYGCYVRFFDVHGNMILIEAEAEAIRADRALAQIAIESSARVEAEARAAAESAARVEAEARTKVESTARAVAEARATAEKEKAAAAESRIQTEVAARASAEAELTRLKQELAALRNTPPRTP